jgi:hypothetical protein
VLRLVQENPARGIPRGVHGELSWLGHQISEATVQRILRARSRRVTPGGYYGAITQRATADIGPFGVLQQPAGRRNQRAMRRLGARSSWPSPSLGGEHLLADQLRARPADDGDLLDRACLARYGIGGTVDARQPAVLSDAYMTHYSRP